MKIKDASLYSHDTDSTGLHVTNSKKLDLTKINSIQNIKWDGGNHFVQCRLKSMYVYTFGNF